MHCEGGGHWPSRPWAVGHRLGPHGHKWRLCMPPQHKQHKTCHLPTSPSHGGLLGCKNGHLWAILGSFRPRPCHFGCPPTNRWHCSMHPGTPEAHWGQNGTMPGPHRALKPTEAPTVGKKVQKTPFLAVSVPALSGPSHLDCFCTIVAGALPHNLGLVHCTPCWPKVCAKCFRSPKIAEKC